ncbi:hypothetical protein J6590_021728 [Homalodisca vitripennis]|nr:hypothetical protein J6590_021728 [Homalodisca vitripennis]
MTQCGCYVDDSLKSAKQPSFFRNPIVIPGYKQLTVKVMTQCGCYVDDSLQSAKQPSFFPESNSYPRLQTIDSESNDALRLISKECKQCTISVPDGRNRRLHQPWTAHRLRHATDTHSTPVTRTSTRLGPQSAGINSGATHDSDGRAARATPRLRPRHSRPPFTRHRPQFLD